MQRSGMRIGEGSTLSIRAVSLAERPDPSPPLISFASTLPFQGRV
ncbi:hypothetical protein ACVJGD_006883 [Bradyrhizobium sp. USDA 10063]